MEVLLKWIGITSGILLAVAVAVAWWEHRKRMAELRRELADSVNSRFELEVRVRAVDERLKAMNATLESQRHDLAATRESGHRKGLLEQTMQRMSTPPAAANPAPAPAAVQPPGSARRATPAAEDSRSSVWPDTLPMVQDTTAAKAAEPSRNPQDLHPH
jgi:hypothetical protein